MIAVQLGNREVAIRYLREASITSATVAFTLKRYGVSAVYLSKGRIAADTRSINLDAGWDDNDLTEESTWSAGSKYAAPGIKLTTQAVEFSIPPDGPWEPGPILSFVWSLKKALPILLACSDSDFQLTWTIYPDHLRVLVADALPGGNGTSQNLWNSLQHSPGDLETIIQEDILKCSCRDLCERCLLLPRTPESYVRRGLISRQHLTRFLGSVDNSAT